MRIPALTGIRGVAVLMVMALHFLPDTVWPQHSWITRIFQMTLGGGVDLFFVLSGFLITGILLDTQNSPHYFRNFFARRFLRIFPLYFGVLAVVFGLLPVLGVLKDDPTRALSAWHWAYLSNVAWYLHPGGLASAQVELTHFWSLAVEEHFYLVWPFVVGLCTPRGVRRVCLVMGAMSLGLRLVWTAYAGDFSLFVFLTPCHLDGLAAGGFLAALTREPQWRRWIPAAKIAVGAILAAIGAVVLGLCHHTTLAHSIGLALFSTLLASAMFLVLGASRQSLPVRVLDGGFLQFFGKYSYGLYVIHGLLIPVLGRMIPTAPWAEMLGSNLLGGVATAVAKIAVVIPLAMASWALYESPILKLKKYFR